MTHSDAKLTFLHLLEPFAGTWKTSGTIKPANQELYGTDSYEWMAGKYFLLHKVDVMMGDIHTESLEMIGFDEEKQHFFMHNYDNEGKFSTMNAVFDKGIWKFTGDTARFSGSFSKDKNTLTGLWEMIDEKGISQPWMDVKLVRQTL